MSLRGGPKGRHGNLFDKDEIAFLPGGFAEAQKDKCFPSIKRGYFRCLGLGGVTYSSLPYGKRHPVPHFGEFETGKIGKCQEGFSPDVQEIGGARGYCLLLLLCSFYTTTTSTGSGCLITESFCYIQFFYPYYFTVFIFF